jgi:hypothetical protein
MQYVMKLAEFFSLLRKEYVSVPYTTSTPATSKFRAKKVEIIEVRLGNFASLLQASFKYFKTSSLQITDEPMYHSTADSVVRFCFARSTWLNNRRRERECWPSPARTASHSCTSCTRTGATARSRLLPVCISCEGQISTKLEKPPNFLPKCSYSLLLQSAL